MPTTTWGAVLKEGARTARSFDDVARALNMLDVASQEGIIKAAVKPVVHSFMEAGRFNRDRQCEEEKEETDEQSGEEEHCPNLDETVAASWIAQIGEDGFQRDRGSGFFHRHERAAPAYLGTDLGTQQGSTKGP